MQDNTTRTIFFIGKPGCGKRMQAKLLSEKTGWAVFSSGKLFRGIAQEDTPVGLRVKQENDVGFLQPYWFAIYLFFKTLFSLPSDRSVIFDGFCRKVSEAELIIDSLRWLGRPFSVLHLVVSDEEIRHRIMLRKELESRADDSAVDERLKEYREYTGPAIELFRKAGMLIEINGEQAREATAEDVCKALDIK
mgnify:CR=1 FL=1